jgi:battenin
MWVERATMVAKAKRANGARRKRNFGSAPQVRQTRVVRSNSGHGDLVELILTGILFASLISMPTEVALCNAQVAAGRTTCRDL